MICQCLYQIKCSCGKWHLQKDVHKVLQEVPFETIKPYLPDQNSPKHGRKRELVINECKFGIKIKRKYHIFKLNPVCVGCGKGITNCLIVKCKGRKDSRVIFCTDEYVMMTVDHVIPRAKGGANHLDNFATMCFKCNSLKGDNSMEEFNEQHKAG